MKKETEQCIGAYGSREDLPPSVAARIGALLGIREEEPLTDVGLAQHIHAGLDPEAAAHVQSLLNSSPDVIAKSTLQRARWSQNRLSRRMSERLYEVCKVLDAVMLAYRDHDAALRFLSTPHPLLNGAMPLEFAKSGSAGANAVLGLLKRAEAGHSV